MTVATSDSISLNTIKTLNDTANDAKTTAEALEQHFWFQETGADAGAHITEVTQEEFTDPTDPNYQSGGNTLITSTGMNVRDGMTTFASFSATGAQIGKSSDTHSVIDANGMRIYASDGTTLIATLGYGVGNNVNGGASTAPFFTLGTRVDNASGLIVQQYDNTVSYDIGEIVEYSGEYYIRIRPSSAGTPPTDATRWKKLPTRFVGNLSITQGEDAIASGFSSSAQGNRCIALGAGAHAEGGTADYKDRGGVLIPFGMPIAVENYSHAEGHSCVASGRCSHAEGNSSISNGDYSHAEGMARAFGDYSHAEGESTTAQGESAHAEGNDAYATGDFSHAQNLGTLAHSTAQTAIGMYNTADSADTYAFIIGNGSSRNARSNAFTVKWTGDVLADGDITDGTGNVLSDKVDASALAPVATSGDYADLINTPALASVATSGDYDDLINKPTIPTVPTNVSAFNNDAGYIPGINFTANAGATKTLSLPNTSAGYIIASGAHVNNQNIYIYNVSSAGAVTLKAMGTASNITTATSTRTITLTGASYATRYTVVAFYGDLPTVS